MPDIGPLGPEYHQMQRIAYPDVPSDCVSKLNDLITAITIASNHLNGSAGQVQSFMHQTNGVVQNVTTSPHAQGKAVQALAKIWNASMTDGNQSHTGMSDASSHLISTIAGLNEHLQTVSAGMQILEAVKSNAGQVLASDVQEIESQLSGLTNAFNNIGMVLNGAATLINTLNSNWPQACATGLVPGTVYPTFVPHAFDSEVPHGNAPADGSMYRSANDGDGSGWRTSIKRMFGKDASDDSEDPHSNENGGTGSGDGGDGTPEEPQGNNGPSRGMQEIEFIDRNGNLVKVQIPRTEPPFDPSQPNNGYFSQNQMKYYEPDGSIYQQQYPTSCMAAAMKMLLDDEGVLNKDGVSVTEEEAIRVAKINPKVIGGKAKNIPQAMRQLGLGSKLKYQYRAMPTINNLEAAMNISGKPAIVVIDRPECNIAHVVVVDHISNGMVAIRDPDYGAYEVPINVFENVYSGEGVIATR